MGKQGNSPSNHNHDHRRGASSMWRMNTASSSSELSTLETASAGPCSHGFCWAMLSWSLQTHLNLQSMRKGSRENSKKSKPKAKRKSFIQGTHKVHPVNLNSSECKVDTGNNYSGRENRNVWLCQLYG